MPLSSNNYAQKYFLITFVIVVAIPFLSEHTEVQIKINQIANKLFLLIAFFSLPFCSTSLIYCALHRNTLAAA